ncbi:hypothetical protein [Pseudogracilibacillus sp. ICA-222130]|uniref:hypothetical protein n=1 Tax=Pseudogracilibacillus sp. ICA-222130 TaxID=3134655 RepID=UPI0030BD278C
MKRNIISIILMVMILFAAFLGWFAQDIAYYFADHLFYQDPFKTLIVVTIISISLFIISFVMNTILLAKQKVNPKIYTTLLLANVFIGFFVSFWSLFVLAMWWG